MPKQDPMTAEPRVLHRAGCALAVAAALAASGCGATSAISNAIDPAAEAATVARAALQTDRIDGFRISATLTMVVNETPERVRLKGVMDTRTGVQDIVERVRIGRRMVSLHELSRAGRGYLDLRGLPGTAHRLGSRPWLEVDMGRAEGIPNPSAHYDPAEFVDLLRAPGIRVHVMASQAEAEGVPATLYRADIDLNRYVRAVPRRMRASSRRFVRFVKQAIGGHVLPEDVWVDGSGLIRQLSWGYSACVAGQSVSAGMLIDFSDFGPQRIGRLPTRAHTRNITPLVRASLGQLERLHLGCGSSA